MEWRIYGRKGNSPFSERKILGVTGAEMLSDRFPEMQWLEDGETPKEGENVALLYDDCPLVSRGFLRDIFKRLKAEKADYALIGKGYVRLRAGEKKLDICDIRATELNDSESYRTVYSMVQKEIAARLESEDVVLLDRDSCHIDWQVKIGSGTVVHPMNVLSGNTVIGKNCTLYAYCDLTDTAVGDGTDLRSTYALSAKIGSDCTLGPYTCLRKGANISDCCRVGDFVEIKNSTLETGVKAAHLAYVGDSYVGEHTNIGCGTVFANYDGKVKRSVVVGKKVFIGCNTNLVAPLQVEDGAYIAAGSTVTQDIPAGKLCIARARQVHKERKNLD